METRIQFRVDEETKRLAQKMAESQGRTISDACREFTVQLAKQQRKVLSQDAWLTQQVNSAFEKLDADHSDFIDHDTAKDEMKKRREKIRKRGSI
ncbi:type II toxin-antitoxin system RelB/DinJ family antitoxin [Endozoicomonas numazuensis]|uniref:Damage-inducible protein J n=1 Tax=Endozoicomonas numazuensis TaxID=1137799 RepID=A0A081NL99_9GAMM|nr:type II toxin-antitoxin system RelB/DinJ family antitoxin [Endozoicomonas numazuensis]KEQ19222.1 damage-inducible protein J [Endozoicomonas numazuensis]